MDALEQRVRELWTVLHATPELGWQEEKTSAFLAEGLRKAGYEVRTGLAGTGVTGLLKGREPGPVIGLRADMDALPYTVDGAPCAKHTCGHDGNSAMLLAAAEELARRGPRRGSLKIIFQPAEEMFTGAPCMLKAGALDDVDILIGQHFRPLDEARLGQAMPALYHAASYAVDAEITGKTTHGARPHLGCNAVDAGAAVVMAVNAIHLDPRLGYSVKVTGFNAGGEAANVIPDKARLILDLRAERNDAMETLLAKVAQAVEAGAASVGAQGKTTVRAGCPAAEYDPEIVAVAGRAIADVLGPNGLIAPVSTAGGEDFHFYARRKPGLRTAYIGLGADVQPSLHNIGMTFNQDALIHGVNILIRTAERLAEEQLTREQPVNGEK